MAKTLYRIQQAKKDKNRKNSDKDGKELHKLTIR